MVLLVTAGLHLVVSPYGLIRFVLFEIFPNLTFILGFLCEDPDVVQSSHSCGKNDVRASVSANAMNEGFCRLQIADKTNI